MCGRFVMVASLADIEDEFDVQGGSGELRRSYNIAPGSTVAAVVNDGSNRIETFQWGLVPSWTKDPARGRMINARAETVAEKPSFKASFRKKRCLVIASGYYEWKRTATGKVPYYIRGISGRPLGFAGIFDSRVSPGRETLRTCAIITTRPNDLVGAIHDRMPAILSREVTSLWLDTSVRDEARLLPLLEPVSGDGLEAYPVSTLVNSPCNDSPRLIEPAGTSLLNEPPV
ncbi:MAG: SOS response-associated peptidase [Deltaproteobacteria bacterium]|nr:SOS response-associated peptidase [Deltaproteobacteria bacterium]